ncbi:hypothetical protein [Companilactobacillus mishanensis]|uniref:DNA-entry nuclease n=1 Tax=Companilactobacillus mishanensis TaxID=2486008 RepID=A0A5P0ZIX2_9LACO|nr:hypothetical protein [Companilactobacillus mishanensis]MQS53066.1 hypothetical protein [Companilactobacillus mishanensis]
MINFLAFVSLIVFIYFLVKYIKNRKTRIGREAKKPMWISLVVFIVLGAFAGAGNSPDEPTKQVSSDEPDIAKPVVIKNVGKGEYDSAKKKNKELLAKKKELSDKADSLDSQMNDIEQAEAAEAKANEPAASEEPAPAPDPTTAPAPAPSTNGNQGNRDLDTSGSQQIVGNVKSRIYHVPGQRGYNMNSRNAVYFQNEQEAQAAGYRRAKV